MSKALLHWIWALILTAILAAGSSADDGAPASENDSADPISYILNAFGECPIVCLAEGGHQANEPHQFLKYVLRSSAILKTVDVIIVEFAVSTHQDVLDAYIRGEDVPFSILSKVWRDTGQSPRAPWDSPLYHEFLDVIREGNGALSLEDKVRVVAGDPPINWAEINTRDDFNRARIPRDPFVASLAIDQAIHQDKKVLIVFGGAHLPRVAVGPETDQRNSLTYRILKQYPGSVRAIGFLDPENLSVGDRIDSLTRGRIYMTDCHWSGGIHAELFFPEIYSLVTNPATGHQSWQQSPLYSGYLVRDLFDALVYIGPSSEWEYVAGSFDQERDKEYLDELSRRSLIRFGRPLYSDQ